MLDIYNIQGNNHLRMILQLSNRENSIASHPIHDMNRSS